MSRFNELRDTFYDTWYYKIDWFQEQNCIVRSCEAVWRKDIAWHLIGSGIRWRYR